MAAVMPNQLSSLVCQSQRSKDRCRKFYNANGHIKGHIVRKQDIKTDTVFVFATHP